MDKVKDIQKYFLSEEVQTAAKTICELARECWELQISDSTGFSVSLVLPETNYVLTDKSGTAFRRNKITPQDLILIDLEANLIYQPTSMGNPRLAPVNVIVHLEGYKASNAKACIHWHDPYTNAFACYNKTINPLSLQSKLIGDVPCVMVDDRSQKKIRLEQDITVDVPSGLHCRKDVYFVMKQVGSLTGEILARRNLEFDRHGIVITHYEHGLFAFGRHVEEAFENGYRAYRNAQTIVYSQLLKDYPDEKAKQNAGDGDTSNVNF